MKLWKKLYLITLTLFLILINCGIYLVFEMTYRKDISLEEKRAQSSFQVLESSMMKNMEVLDVQGKLGEAQIRTLMETYEQYYHSQNVELKMWGKDDIIYPKEGEKRQKSFFDEDKELITIVTEDKIKNICITKKISDFHQEYYLYYRQPLAELTNTWKELQKRYTLMSVAFSVLLAIILLLVLRRLMKPVADLSRAVDEMKNGEEYTPSHVTVRGNDDIAKLSTNFNEMADTIADNMLQMQEEGKKKQQFIDNFSHELKSPLTSIYGFAEYVGKANITDSEKEECMTFIMEESNRMLNLSYTLLDMSRLREQELKMDDIGTEELCSQVGYQLKEKLAENRIKFSTNILTKKIYGNQVLLQSLIGNLVSNAMNACNENGQIELEISDDGKQCFIRLKDNGCGMTKEQIAHIFEPFYRVDKSRSRERGGTGLGLSLCRQIARAHNGDITFQSIVGKGTIATVTLPLITK